MRKRRKANHRGELAKIAFALIGIGLIWVGIKLGIHDQIGRAIIAPLQTAPKPSRS